MCDNKTLLFYKGISHLPTSPNRYPYLYDVRPYNTLYGPEMSSKPFPYTNRPRAEYPMCSGFTPYTNLLDYCKLRKCELTDMGWWNSGTGYVY